MRNATFLLALLAAYFVGWTGSYILFWVLRGDTIPFKYYFDYLFAAWTFGGIEGAPQFMLIGSIVLFIPIAVLLFVLRKRLKHGSLAP